MSKSIILKNYLNIFEEYTATAVVITPGMLLEPVSAGTIQAHSTAGGNVLPMFALEDALQGRAISDNYVVSSKIQVWIPQRGDQAYAILNNNQDVAIGDFLESDGAGALNKHAADDSSGHPTKGNQIVAQALEAVDTLDSSAESSSAPLGLKERIKVRIV